MPAPDQYIVKTVVFTPEGGAAQPIAGLVNCSIADSGSRLTWSGDGVATVQAQTMEDIESAISVNAQDPSLLNNANLAIGKVGSLVVTMQKRAQGRGAASGSDVIATMAAAMIENRSNGIPHRGESTVDFNFTGVNADGNDAISWT